VEPAPLATEQRELSQDVIIENAEVAQRATEGE
jgi:hypothetical protein